MLLSHAGESGKTVFSWPIGNTYLFDSDNHWYYIKPDLGRLKIPLVYASTFRPECIDTDGELDMECLDSGMVLFRENCTPGEALESSYRQAFGKEYCETDAIVLMEE